MKTTKKTAKTPRATRPVGKRTASGITEETRVSRHGDIASRTIDDQEIVVVPATRKMQILNEVATRIWALSDGRTVGEIADAITSEYEVDRRTALADVIGLVRTMLDRGMIVAG